MFSFGLRLSSKLSQIRASNLVQNVYQKCLEREYRSMVNKSRSVTMSLVKKRSGVAVSLAGCCFSMCKKRKTEDEQEPNIPTERSKLLSSFSPKKSNDDSEIGSRDLSDSIDQSGVFPNSLVRVSTGDVKPQKSASIVSFKADIVSQKLDQKSLESFKVSPEEESIEPRGGEKKRKRPNYFVALQISNPGILEGLKEVQDKILRRDPRLEPALVSLKKLHITLMVFHAEDNRELEKAVEALDASFASIKSWMEKSIDLEISKVSNFKNQVVFAGIKDDEHKENLFRMVEEVNGAYEKRGFDVREETKERRFSPHLTLFKLSKAPRLAKKGIRKIDPDLYQDFNEKVFGVENVKSLQLLSMNEKDESGYYKRISEFNFGAN